jgi:hypothetical protein
MTGVWQYRLGIDVPALKFIRRDLNLTFSYFSVFFYLFYFLLTSRRWDSSPQKR